MLKQSIFRGRLWISPGIETCWLKQVDSTKSFAVTIVVRLLVCKFIATYLFFWRIQGISRVFRVFLSFKSSLCRTRLSQKLCYLQVFEHFCVGLFISEKLLVFLTLYVSSYDIGSPPPSGLCNFFALFSVVIWIVYASCFVENWKWTKALEKIDYLLFVVRTSPETWFLCIKFYIKFAIFPNFEKFLIGKSPKNPTFFLANLVFVDI